MTGLKKPVRKDGGTRPSQVVPRQFATEGPSFTSVFEEEFSFVWRVLRHLGVPEADVDDVTQDVFVVVHRKLDTWEPRHPIRSWLYAICRGAARTRARRAHVRREHPTDAPPEGSWEQTPDRQIAANRALSRVQGALTQTDPAVAEVFLMFELEGMSMKEIARAMGCPLKTAYSRLRLAREHLRRTLRAPEGPNGGRRD